MILWKPIATNLEANKEYVVTDGKRIATAHYNTPYNDKSIWIWYSNAEKGYVHMNITHYAEISELNLPN